MNFKGIIFDMRGVLVGTESLKAGAHSDTTAFLGRRVDKIVYVNLLTSPLLGDPSSNIPTALVLSLETMGTPRLPGVKETW